MHNSPRIAALLAIAGGSAWIVDVAIIAVLDRSFGVADDALFFAGLLAIVAASGVAGVALAGDRRGPVKVAWIAGAIVAVVIATTALSSAVDAAFGAAYSGGNQALEEEMGVAAISVLFIGLGLVALRRPTAAPSPTSC